MKKCFLFILTITWSLYLYSQEFRWELQYGVDLDSKWVSEEYEGTFGLGLVYERKISETLIIGMGTSFNRYQNRDIIVNIAPVFLSTRLEIAKGLIIGSDLGRVFPLQNNNYGGLYYRPIILYEFSEFDKGQISLSLQSFRVNDHNLNALSIGISSCDFIVFFGSLIDVLLSIDD